MAAEPRLSLSSEKIVETVGTLSRRIEERFPSSSLAGVCHELFNISRHAREQAATFNQPINSLRIGTAILVAIIVAGLAATLFSLRIPENRPDFISFIQFLEAGINDVVLISVAIFFLVTLERRIKRGRALKAMHELRAMAHIIDMHQLTKDPGLLVAGVARTESSPPDYLPVPQMIRYLDYCSEMLALTGKIAALYIQKFDDPVVLVAANEIESLTTGLSRKIWQKILIAETVKE